MNASIAHIAPVRRKGWFFSALLLVLMSALAAALVPSGPPASRLVGSAFDPSTSAVALRVRVKQPAEESASAQRKPDKDVTTAGIAPMMAILFSMQSTFTGRSVAVGQFVLPRSSPVLLDRFVSSKRARAPPLTIP